MSKPPYTKHASVFSFRSSRRHVRLLVALVLPAILLSSCSGEQTPESIAAAFIERCETIVEKRQLLKCKDLFSERYQDRHGRNKQEIVSIATGYLFRNRSIHVFSRLSSVVQRGEVIEMTILAALAGSPISDAGALPKLNADMYWFYVTLAEEGKEWLVSTVSWRQAMLDDFL